jgi:hypothetical protein
MGASMAGSKIDREAHTIARNDELIAHAAKLAGWAGDALTSAANDLSDAHSSDRRPLTGLTQVVTEAAARVSSLANDIECHRSVSSRAAPQSVTRYTAVMD